MPRGERVFFKMSFIADQGNRIRRGVDPDDEDWYLLEFDGHESHVNIAFLRLCRANHIICLQLPSHTSDMVQTNDVGLFGPLQRAYSRICTDKMRVNERISKASFARCVHLLYRSQR